MGTKKEKESDGHKKEAHCESDGHKERKKERKSERLKARKREQ